MSGADLLVSLGVGLLVLLVLWAKWYGRYLTRKRPPAGTMEDADFGKVHVIRRGDPETATKSPIVLIHGSTTNALDMDFDLAGRLSDDRYVVMPDRLGHGFSERPENGWRLDVQAAAIKDVLDREGLERPIILGQSYGGAVALRFALDYPDDLAGLVLIAPVTHRWPGGVAWYNRVAINPLYGWLFRHTFIALYGRYGSPRAVAQALKGSDNEAAYHSRTRVGLTFRPLAFRNNAEDIVRLFEQLVAMDTRYGEIPVPTEIVAGTHDMTVITTVHGRSLERQIDGASLRVIDHAGHALHHTHPEETIAAINRLDQRLASEGRSPLQGALRRLSSVIPGA